MGWQSVRGLKAVLTSSVCSILANEVMVPTHPQLHMHRAWVPRLQMARGIARDGGLAGHVPQVLCASWDANTFACQRYLDTGQRNEYLPTGEGTPSYAMSPQS